MCVCVPFLSCVWRRSSQSWRDGVARCGPWSRRWGRSSCRGICRWTGRTPPRQPCVTCAPVRETPAVILVVVGTVLIFTLFHLYWRSQCFSFTTLFNFLQVLIWTLESRNSLNILTIFVVNQNRSLNQHINMSQTKLYAYKKKATSNKLFTFSDAVLRSRSRLEPPLLGWSRRRFFCWP